MSSDQELTEVRSEAKAILDLDQTHLQALFFAKTMKRNLSRTVRHLDRLVATSGEDRQLGNLALARLGFSSET